MRSRPRRALAVRLCLLAVVGCGAAPRDASAGPIDLAVAGDRKALEVLAADFAKARPKTKFERWDPAVRADLVARASKMTLREGALPAVRDVFWKALKANPPGPPGRGGGKDATSIPTPYGPATWLQKGQGGAKNGLVVGLHGGGEGAGDAGEAAGKWTLPECLAMYPQGIQLVHDTWNTVHGERFVLTLLEIAKVRHDVDPDRVYACGFSMGGTGSWFLAGRHPDLLAGAAPCAGVLMAAPKSQVATAAEVQELQHGFVPNVRNLAMYWFIGLADKNCMPGTYLYAWDRLLELRKADPTGYAKLQFTTYPDLPHTFPPGEPSACLKWLGKQRRDAEPETIVWEQAEAPYPLPETDLDRRLGRLPVLDLYWLHCDRPTDRALVRASRKGNEFEVSVTGGDVRDLSIWLHGDLIAPGQEVVVRSAGKELYRGTPTPNVAAVLESLDARVDRRLTYDRRVTWGDR
ncbi:MAG: hypothetical protein U1E39_16175 [Planctomycetota bacterium]